MNLESMKDKLEQLPPDKKMTGLEFSDFITEHVDEPRSGIECPDCGSKGSTLYNGEITGGNHVRWRKCDKCPVRWSTVEVFKCKPKSKETL